MAVCEEPPASLEVLGNRYGQLTILRHLNANDRRQTINK